ncbi:MAG TPA: ATP-binding cassette domain-containing protein [Casimicrobiaceae bacterium]|nr:ATP-binding cassette domain-containing protein [Casimicrobiaceae bacterium]
MIEVDSLEFCYGTTRVLDIAQWRAGEGEAWLVTGPSGSGKTTLLHLVAGLVTPTRGRIVVAGTDVASLASHARDRWRGQHVGIVPQKLHLIGAVDVADNLRLAQRLCGLDVDEARIAGLLEALQVGNLAHRFPRELSQGQAQRVAIARAVVNRPAVVLADEPTANLDDAHAAAALELLRAQALAVGATLVVASHDARVRLLLTDVLTLPMHAVERAA